MTTQLEKQAGLEKLLMRLGGAIGRGGDRLAGGFASHVAPKLMTGAGAAGHLAQGLGSDLAAGGRHAVDALRGTAGPTKGLLPWLGEHPVRRGVALPALGYYGAEMASAPMASDKTMEGKRENYWGSVAAGAGDPGSSGHNRMMDWLLTPGRAIRAGGATNSGVPNKLTGGEPGDLFHQTDMKPGKFGPDGATNPTETGTINAPLSNFQRAQQAQSLQLERQREQGLNDYVDKVDQPMYRQSEEAQQHFQQAFPHTKIPGVQPIGKPTFSQLLGHGAASAATEEEDSPLHRIPHVGGPSSPEELEAIYKRWK
jgi:hypothetical protein